MKDIKYLPRKTSFTSVYPQNVIIFYGIFDTTSIYAETIPGYQTTFQSVGLYSYSRDIRRMLSRLLFQPSKELQDSIMKTLKANDFSNCISIQLRMGGKVAESEDMPFLPMNKMIEYVKEINAKYTHNESVYLTTDSPSVIPTVQKLLSNHRIIQNNDFRISHSALNRKNHRDGMKRAIVDAILASHCNPIYRTLISSYGQLIENLSFNSRDVLLRYHVAWADVRNPLV